MSKRRGGRRRPTLERVYGWFHCKNCRRGWESSHVYCIEGTLKVVYRQGCKTCGTSSFPYQTDYLICSECGEQQCQCALIYDSYDDDDDAYDSDDDGDLRTSRNGRDRHVDAKKPHLTHLCQKCQAGYLCARA
ncbi:zygote arrest protein 1-like [Haliotis cracherodii]|uniref:zygote arrest protein 1-like n=1 Tax=Haliotis cracherodii TaxID=6455 RepID=UPI0039E8BA3C